MDVGDWSSDVCSSDLYLSISLSLYLSISLSLYVSRRHPEGTQEAPRRFPRGQEAPKRLPRDSQDSPGGSQKAPRTLPEGSQEAPRRHPGGSQGNQGSKRPLREGRAIVYAFLLCFMQKLRSFVTFTSVFEGPMILDAFLQATIARGSTRVPS